MPGDGTSDEAYAELDRIQRIAGVASFEIDVAANLNGMRTGEYRHLHGLPDHVTAEPHADWLARVHPADRAAAELTLLDALTGQANVYDNLYRIVRPADGEVRWIHARGEIERDAGGNPLRLIGVHIDVTAQKQAEAALAKTQARQQLLLEIGELLPRLRDPHEIEAATAEAVARAIGAPWACFCLPQELPGEFVVHGGFADAGASLPDRIRINHSARLLRGEPLSIATVSVDPHGTASALVVPVMVGGALSSALLLAADSPRDWAAVDQDMVAEVATRAWNVRERAAAEVALRESEDRLRVALEAGRMGTWRFELATGHQQWSEQQFRLYGLEPGAVAPSRELFLSLVYPDDLGAVSFDDQDLLPDRGLLDAEFRIIRPDGQVRWLVSHTTVRRAADGRPLEMVGVNWDITERREAEQALRDSEQGLRMALEAGRMGTYRFDVRSGIEHWSDSEYDLLGLPKSANPLTREDFLAIVHPDDRHLVQFTADDGRAPGTPLNTEFRIIRPDTGETRHLTAHALARFDSDGRPSEVIGINRDVSAERRAELALRASEERLQQFSNASSDILWMRDAQTLQWVYLSPAFDRIYGITRQDALLSDNLQSWLDLIQPEDRESVVKALEAVREGGRETYEFRIRRPDGGMRWLRNTDFPVRSGAGTITHVAGVAADVTSLREAAEHQRVLLSELQHRVRNTLGVVRSIGRRTAETAGSVEEFAMKFEGRIDAFARVQSAVTRDPNAGVELGTIVAEEMRAAILQEGRGLSVSGEPLRLSSKAAETLGLAIHELATNAIKYGALSVPQGSIVVSWGMEFDDGGGQLLFNWLETGLSGLEPPVRRGLGTEIIEETLRYELGARTSLDFIGTGLHCTIAIPLQRIAQVAP